MENKPLVSVCMITYNHERYIAEAIEGVLMQKTDFPIELVIGEDCSTDGNRDICRDFRNRFPKNIKLLESSRNLGMSSNFIWTLKNCSGKYVALCEGDDYWTDPSKLQKQVEFLEANPAFSMCFHNAVVLESTGRVREKPIATSKRDVIHFKDIVNKSIGYVPTASCLYRRSCISPFPDSLPPLDWVLMLLASSHGSVKFINETMSVYRLHEGGWTHSVSSAKAKDIVNITKACKAFFDPEYSEAFDRALAHWGADICFAYYREKDRPGFLQAYDNLRYVWKFLRFRTSIALMVRKFLVMVEK